MKTEQCKRVRDCASRNSPITTATDSTIGLLAVVS